jgi:hypothetical protein
MAFPSIPTSYTPTARDSLFTALGLDPGLAVSATITHSYVMLEFIATDDNGDLIRGAANEYINQFTIPVEEP